MAEYFCMALPFIPESIVQSVDRNIRTGIDCLSYCVNGICDMVDRIRETFWTPGEHAFTYLYETDFARALGQYTECG